MINVDSDLLDKLKALRRELADKANVPAYIIFTNATLIDMCKKLPTSSAAFLNVSGVGKQKLALYGEKFLELIRKHIEKNEDN